jgi:hypothetical protein
MSMVPQDLRLAARGGERHIAKRVQGIELRLRRLGDERIGDAVFRVEPERRVGLEAARQREQQVVGHLALGQPHILRAAAVDLDVELRIVEILLDAHVGNARHVADLRLQFLRERVVGCDVKSADLDINGRRGAEIQNLADDVGGQESEADAGIRLRQRCPQLTHIVRGRAMVFFQRDENVGIGGRGRRGVAVREVDAADRQADIVDHARYFGPRNGFPDGRLDLIGEPCGFLDPQAGMAAQVQLDLTAVDRRKEVTAEPRDECKRRQHAAEEHRDEDAAPCNHARENLVVAHPQRLEAALKGTLHCD